MDRRRPVPVTLLLLPWLLVGLLAAPLARAAEKSRLSVAVMEFTVLGNLGSKGGGAIVAEWLVSALGESNTFTLRERVLLKKVLAEQHLALTGLVDEGSHATVVGKLYGLDAVISGSVFRWGNSVTVTARLIDASTGAIRQTAEIRATDLEAVPGRIHDLARILTGQISQAEADGNRLGGAAPNYTGGGVKLELAGTTWVEPFTGLEFVLLKGGCYQMGLTEAERRFLVQEYGAEEFAKLYGDEAPRHEVCVDDFWLARHETSNRQFRLFRPDHDSLDYRGRTLNDDRQPAVYTSWEDARAFADWLSARYPDRTFRLPTEAEWEKGCRAGTETPRFWGWDADEACRFANVHDRGAEKENHFGWEPHDCDDGFVVTAPVGSLAPNPAGLHDMLGNVWEWTQDIYRPDAYQNHGRENPVIAEGGNTRVRRGGCWNNEDGGIRCANRSDREAKQQNNRVGFRLLMQVKIPALQEVAAPKKSTLPLAELPLTPERNSYRFRFTNQTASVHALVVYSPLPSTEVLPDYSGLAMSFKVFDGEQQLLLKSSSAMARFGEAGDDEYGAFFVAYHVPEELPLGKNLTGEVEFSGPLAAFLARRGSTTLALLPAPE